MKKSNTPEKTIAVLPFVNISTNEDMEYFSDGITEEIINALAQIEAVKVTSRTSSFYFKNKNIPIKQIAGELNVAAILEGSVRHSADTVRITAQLIHAEEDFHFWSETWDRKLENIFEIQDEISLLIADKMREQYGHFDIQDHLVERKTENLDAYEYSLKARYHFNKWNPVAARTAIDLYEKAIALDPLHADSLVGLADAYSFLVVTEIMSPEEVWPKVKDLIQRANSINPRHAGVHYQLANIAFFQETDFQKAFQQCLKSIELKPNYSEAQQFMSFLYVISDEMEKAEKHLGLALEIDPLSPETLFYKAYFKYRRADYKGALTIFNKLLDKNPKNIPAFIVRAYCLLKLAEYEEAIHQMEAMPEEILVHDERLGVLCLANILKKDDEKAQTYLEKLTQEAEKPTSFQAHSYLFLAYVNLGMADEAFALLDKATQLKSSVLLLTFTDPLADNLKTDLRYTGFKESLYFRNNTSASLSDEKSPLIDSATAQQYTHRLLEYCKDEQPFLIPNLSLRMLAAQVEIHPNKLSWILNEKLGKNFNEFINHFRIEYFKKLALNPENSHISLIGLAYESGFNSKTVFNTYFRKETGKTPKEFLKNLS